MSSNRRRPVELVQVDIDTLTMENEDDLHQNGDFSHASVNVMLALKDAFDVVFPDFLLRRGTLRFVSCIEETQASLGVVVAKAN